MKTIPFLFLLLLFFSGNSPDRLVRRVAKDDPEAIHILSDSSCRFQPNFRDSGYIAFREGAIHYIAYDSCIAFLDFFQQLQHITWSYRQRALAYDNLSDSPAFQFTKYHPHLCSSIETLIIQNPNNILNCDEHFRKGTILQLDLSRFPNLQTLVLIGNDADCIDTLPENFYHAPRLSKIIFSVITLQPGIEEKIRAAYPKADFYPHRTWGDSIVRPYERLCPFW